MRSYVRSFKCENVNVRSVRNEDCESGYVRSRPYIPICEPEGRDRVEKENPYHPTKEAGDTPELGSDQTDVSKHESAVFSDFFSDGLIDTFIGMDFGSKSWNLKSGIWVKKNFNYFQCRVPTLDLGSS